MLLSYLFALGQFLVLSNALPLMDTNSLDRKFLQNESVLGILAFICMIAMLGACVCCRRRKRGFEEFKNERSGGDNQRSEYPIFRALSPDPELNPPSSSNSPAIIVINSQHNLSRDRLLDQDIDNNNGPISPADLENIENNNAVDYIPNLNEIGQIDHTNFTINRNLVQESLPYHSQINSTSSNLTPLQLANRDQYNGCSASSAAVIHQIESQPSPPSPIAQPIAVNEIECHVVNVSNYHNPFTNTNDVAINVEPSWSTAYQTSPPNKLNSEMIQTSSGTHENINVYQNPFFKDDSNNQCSEDVLSQIIKEYNSGGGNLREELQQIDENITTTGQLDDNFSIQSYSSDKSNDVNSIEEALLALDSVLADEDTPGQDDDEDYDDNDITLNADDLNYQNIIKQCIINSANNSMEFNTTEDILLHDKNNDDEINKLNMIREEAEKFVDNVLIDSERIANERLAINNQISEDLHQVNETMNLNTENVSSINDAKSSEEHKNNENFKSELCSNLANNKTIDLDITPINNLTLLVENENNNSSNINFNPSSSTETMENLFIIAASTPLVKINAQINDNKDARELLREQFHNMIENDSLIVNENLEKVNQTFDVSFMPLNQEIEDGTFIKDPNTLEIAKFPEINDATYINDDDDDDQLPPPPPEIKIDKDETNSEDMTTITPVNTPIELNYSIDTWDRFISNSFKQNVVQQNQVESVFDVNQPSTSTGIGGGTTSVNGGADNCGGSEGWFLHPPNNSNRDDTFDVEEDEENLNLTYEALRKQLAEVLPHAQGMAGPPEYSDDEDSSTQNDKTFDEYRSPLNKYDELDEALASSLPPPPNEIIINYKRPLSPILEESEEETFKTFVLNETKYLDSTSPGYMECSEVALGVTRPLMASNDTLFNLEDTFGDDPFSPHANSQTDLSKIPQQNPNETINIEKANDGNEEIGQANIEKINLNLNFDSIRKTRSFEVLDDGDLCSPDQAKTFSEDINLTEPRSSDLSVTADQDGTFTTVDEKTCITIGQDMKSSKDNERISEISEPDWENNDDNSLLGISMDALVNEDLPIPEFVFTIPELLEQTFEVLPIPDIESVIEDQNEVKDFEPRKDKIQSIPDIEITEGTDSEHSEEIETLPINTEISSIQETEKPVQDKNIAPELNENLEKNPKDTEIYIEHSSSNSCDGSDEEKINLEINSQNEKIDKNVSCSEEKLKDDTEDDYVEKNNSNPTTSEEEKINCENISETDKRDTIEETLKSDFSFNSQDNIKDEGISSKEESGNETENSMNDDDNENEDEDYDEDEDDDDDNDKNDKKSCNQITNFTSNQDHNDDPSNRENSNKTNSNLISSTNLSIFQTNSSNILEFLNKEVEHASSQYYYGNNRHIHSNGDLNIKDLDTNDNLNTKNFLDISTKCSFVYKLPISNVQPILVEQNDSYLIDLSGKEIINNGNNINKFVHLDLIRPNKYQPVIGNYGIYVGDNDDSGVIVNNSMAHQNLSGEEDPWSNFHSVPGIDFVGSNSDYINSTLNLNEWESEEDESNSSEEFMYVKGNSLAEKSNTYKENCKNENEQEKNANVTVEGSADDNMWISHEDQIAVASEQNFENEFEEESCDDSSSDVEEEFVPSSWDAEAQPARSALKSPDKSSSEEEIRCIKKRRSVAFKKQRYHSVYEYPREILPLSPSFSDAKIWERNSSSLETSDYNSDSDVLDGFMISSSTRPFHGSQFNTQCNTWPTDSDFSWSQFQNYNDDQNINYQNYSETAIEWPQEFGEFFSKNGTKENVDGGEMTRPDSGVGESAELLSESVSLGDLRHTKSSLRLPLNIVSVNSLNQESIPSPKLIEINEKLDNFLLSNETHHIGSVDSLSSSSGSSDRKISFTTFGKNVDSSNSEDNRVKNNSLNNENDKNTNKNKPSIVFVTDNNNVLNHQDEIQVNDTYDRSKRQSDSTDEDSGIENIMRFTK